MMVAFQAVGFSEVWLLEFEQKHVFAFETQLVNSWMDVSWGFTLLILWCFWISKWVLGFLSEILPQKLWDFSHLVSQCGFPCRWRRRGWILRIRNTRNPTLWTTIGVYTYTICIDMYTYTSYRILFHFSTICICIQYHSMKKCEKDKLSNGTCILSIHMQHYTHTHVYVCIHIYIYFFFVAFLQNAWTPKLRLLNTDPPTNSGAPQRDIRMFPMRCADFFFRQVSKKVSKKKKAPWMCQDLLQPEVPHKKLPQRLFQLPQGAALCRWQSRHPKV